MKAQAICDYCKKPIKEDEEIFYRKGFLNDEDYCSSDCLRKDILANLEIRTRSDT